MKIHRSIGAVAGLLTAMTLITACAASTDPVAEEPEASTEEAAPAAESFKVGLSWNEKNIALVQAWQDYMQQLAEEEGLNVEWVINVADNDPSRQASNIEDLINQEVDVIIARAEDSAAIGASIRAADAAGIPFITFDRASSTDQPTVHVGGDSYDQALTTGNELASILTAAGVTGQCIELQGALTDVNALNRSKGFADVDAESDAFEIITQVPTEWNPDLFLSGATNALRANPDANCMIIASDFALPSVQSALEGANKWAATGEDNHIWFATQDVFPEAYVAMKAGFIDVGTTYDAYAHAQELVRVLGAIIEGADPGCGPDGCLAKGRVATPDTVDSLENLWSRDYNPDGTKK
jgi:ABC-type sugar transport system substrate-binding protein